LTAVIWYKISSGVGKNEVLIGIGEVAKVDRSRVGGVLIGIGEVAKVDRSRVGGVPRLHGIPGI
jgi:hypothetical protein